MTELLRHIRACNNAILPGDRLPVLVSTHPVGFVKPSVARLAADHGAALTEDALSIPPYALQKLARALADTGLCRWRDEPFDIRATLDAPILGQIDRGLMPVLGLRSFGVHVNGLVADHLWVAHRSPNKPLDPGKLDHIVAGGIPAAHTPEQTLVKEGAEEASLPEPLLRHARRVATLSYAMDRDEGLRRDTLFCYDLELPPDFIPTPNDDEVDRFELWPLDRVLDTVRRTDDFKFNVNLVLIDLFIRRGLLSPSEAATLHTSLYAETENGRKN